MTLANMDASHLTPAALENEIAVFRRFNRMYTRFLGTLNEKLLASKFGLAEARVLYELATRSAPKATDIIQELGMDAGYVSRIVGKFERESLLKRKTSEQDGRATELMLTASGKAAFKKLNSLSEKQAKDVFRALPSAARRELIRCMRGIEDILPGKDRSQQSFVLRPHRVGDMGWVVYSEAVGYAQQFGWNQSFEALVARIVSDFIGNFDGARERCWIAEADGEAVGHIFLVKHPKEAHSARLRLLFVEPCARGMGLGDALVGECIRFARSAGYRKIVLWTQSFLTAAHRIYEKAGFRLVKEEAHHSFGHDLIGQEWELEIG